MTTKKKTKRTMSAETKAKIAETRKRNAALKAQKDLEQKKVESKVEEQKRPVCQSREIKKEPEQDWDKLIRQKKNSTLTLIYSIVQGRGLSKQEAFKEALRKVRV